MSFQGLSNDLLKLASTNPTEFSAMARSILDFRGKVLTKANESELLEVHATTNGTLYGGDCIKLLSSSIIADDSIDCIFADPPFNLSKDYGDGINDSLSDEEYLEWTRTWLDLCCKKLKDGGSFFVFNIPKWANYIAHHLNQSLVFKNWITVDMTLSMPIPSKLYPSHYSLLYFVKGGKPNHFTPPRTPLKTCVRCGKEQNDYGGYKSKLHPGGLTLRDVWTDISPVRHSKHKNRNANELSIKLLDRVLDIATQKGDLVFDPFGGSGTTYAVAEMLERKWIGIELGETSHIVNRLSNPYEDQLLLEKYHREANTLFTDTAIEKRITHGLSVDKFRVSSEQLRRVASKKKK